MQKTYRQGAIGALLDEYERAIIDLQQVISHVSNTQLTTIADHTTHRPRLRIYPNSATPRRKFGIWLCHLYPKT
jgi:hypothetical protein